MRRFVYTPGLEVFIRSADTNRVYDVSDDVINGSVTRRINAVSDASLVLQNKFGKYTTAFKPMDRIAIFLTRTKRVLAFTGFLDEAPLFQLYPGPVTINASCTLKLLQNTYFDPGLPFVAKFFHDLGWQWDPAKGQVFDPGGTSGNQDIFGGVAHLLIGDDKHNGVLPAIGGWPRKHIHILKLPNEFLNRMGKILKETENEDKQDMVELKARLFKLLSADGAGPLSDSTPEPTTPGVAGKGVLSYKEVAKVAYARGKGFRGEDLVTAIAVAYAESTFSVGATHTNSDGSKDRGLWQINSVHSQFNAKRLLSDPDYNAFAAREVWRTSTWKSGHNFYPWTTWRNGVYATLNGGVGPGSKARNAAHSVDSTVTAIVGTPGGIPAPGVTGDTFLFPIDTSTGYKYTTPTGGLVFGAPRGGRKHSGVDLPAPEGTPLIACVDGTVVDTSEQHGGSGKRVIILEDGTTRTFAYYHLRDDPLVSVNTHVTMGDPVGFIGQTGAATGPHLHFEVHPKGKDPNKRFDFNSAINPLPILVRAWKSPNRRTAITGAGSFNPSPRNIDEVTAAIGRQSAFWYLQLSTSDMALATSLSGKRALANDISLFNWIEAMVQASGREFMSMPNGDFLAFYPDYFGWYGRHPYFNISDIEITDFTIQMTDRELATHVFVTGPRFGGSQESFLDRMLPMVASVEENAFDKFINAKGFDFKPMEFLKKYGARPKNVDMNLVRHPLLLWIGAWSEFARQWATQFQTAASFTFLPELIPGGLISIDQANLHLTMYVSEVTHSFDRTAGFTTNATLMAPATKSPGLGGRNLGPMVLSGPR